MSLGCYGIFSWSAVCISFGQLQPCNAKEMLAVIFFEYLAIYWKIKTPATACIHHATACTACNLVCIDFNSFKYNIIVPVLFYNMAFCNYSYT